jgi:6-phosphogluconate dehydrogenase
LNDLLKEIGAKFKKVRDEFSVYFFEKAPAFSKIASEARTSVKTRVNSISNNEINSVEKNVFYAKLDSFLVNIKEKFLKNLQITKNDFKDMIEDNIGQDNSAKKESRLDSLFKDLLDKITSKTSTSYKKNYSSDLTKAFEKVRKMLYDEEKDHLDNFAQNIIFKEVFQNDFDEFVTDALINLRNALDEFLSKAYY